MRGPARCFNVISEKSDEIAARILNELDRGVTKLKAQGAYSGRPLDVLLCAVRRDEAHSVMDLIHEEDENAFLIVGDANSITGEGFRPVKPEDKTIRELAASLKEKRRVRKTGKQ